MPDILTIYKNSNSYQIRRVNTTAVYGGKEVGAPLATGGTVPPEYKNNVKRFEEGQKSVYGAPSIYGDNPGFNFGFRQPFVWVSPSDSDVWKNIKKFDSRSFPVGSVAQDTMRIGKMLVSGQGVSFLATQFLLQGNQKFNETALYNPTSIINAVVRPASFGLLSRTKRHFEMGGSVGGTEKLSKFSIDGNKGLMRSRTGGAAAANPAYSRWSGGQASQNSLMTTMISNLAPGLGTMPAQQGTYRPDDKTYESMIKDAGKQDGFLKPIPQQPTEAGGGQTANKEFKQLYDVKKPFPKESDQRKSNENNSGGQGSSGGGSPKHSAVEQSQGSQDTKRTKDGSTYDALKKSMSKQGNAQGDVNTPRLKPTETINQNFEQINFGEGSDPIMYITRPASDKSVISKGSFVDPNSKYVGNGKTIELDSLKTYAGYEPGDSGNNSINEKNHNLKKLIEGNSGEGKRYTKTYDASKFIKQIKSDEDTSKNYSTKKEQDTIEKKYGFGQSGKNLKRGTEDSYNTLGVESTDKFPVDDIIPFYFNDVVNEKYIPFRATLTGITIGNNAEWDTIQYIGRADKIYVYKGFSRDLGFTFSVYANSIKELQPMWKRINYLQGLIQPAKYKDSSDGAGSGFIQPPFVKIRIGDLFKNQPAILTSVNVNVPDDSTWELIKDGDGYSALNGGDSSEVKNEITAQVPMRIDISVQMTLLEKQRPQTGYLHMSDDDNSANFPLSIKVT